MSSNRFFNNLQKEFQIWKLVSEYWLYKIASLLRFVSRLYTTAKKHIWIITPAEVTQFRNLIVYIHSFHNYQNILVTFSSSLCLGLQNHQCVLRNCVFICGGNETGLSTYCGWILVRSKSHMVHSYVWTHSILMCTYNLLCPIFLTSNRPCNLEIDYVLYNKTLKM